MHFSKLRLTGFKSFVDQTELVIQDGLTGIVGPNGCGKSNLLEAIRWVMGENRPTAMRGGGMEDVIFAGAATRTAKNFAEVSLILDNSERLAPKAFNNDDLIEIVRRITRDIGSAFKASGKDVRARDVQMLFADASTGAHSPALVRQGQIAELINAKPQNRRRILEEAAGISGLYQRRHEAELKLKGAETNLVRVDDVLEQLATQLHQLSRQARQAKRYREIMQELIDAEGVLLYRRWKEADETRLKSQKELQECTIKASQSEQAVREFSSLRSDAEAKIPPLREKEAIASSLLQRLEVERDTLGTKEADAKARIETINIRLSQLTLDLDREAELNSDAAETIKSLEWEAAQLEKASEGHDTKVKKAAEQAHEASHNLQEKEAKLSQMTEDVARLAARHQSAERYSQEIEVLISRHKSEALAAEASRTEALKAQEKTKDDLNLAEKSFQAAMLQSKEADESLITAEETRNQTQALEVDARAALSSAEGEANAISAEVSALAKILERDTMEGGQVIDRLQVEHGFEKALGAALADDLRSPQVQEDGPSGWISLEELPIEQDLPAGVTPMTHHVSVPEVLNRRISQIGLVDADDGPKLQRLLKPGQRLVSTDGDLWRWDGFRAWSEDAPTATSLRLEQLNRLEELKQLNERANVQLEAAKAAHETLTKRLADDTQSDRAARDRMKDADSNLSEAQRAQNRAEAELSLAVNLLETSSMTLSRHKKDLEVTENQMVDAKKVLDELANLEDAKAEVEEAKNTVELHRAAMLSKRALHDEVRREGDERTKRVQEVAKGLSGWNYRLETAEKRNAELIQRQDDNKEQLQNALAEPENLSKRRDEVLLLIKDANNNKNVAQNNLISAESILRDHVEKEREAERSASSLREARARAEAMSEAAHESVDSAAERIVDEMQLSPEELLEKLGKDPEKLPNSEKIEIEVNRLKRQRDSLGAVNLRAEEDMLDVQAEHDNLESEKTDLTEAIKSLRNGIGSLNREGRERLLTAFEEVNNNFSILFKHLFGGGEANLVMVESDDPLEAGLEIMCQPPGKKLSTLSLLSGGEQTLTALALIFAVFLANPAPICVLDEVDAPLDDANVSRFCDMLDEMCRRTNTRFMIITHHAVTMARMDRLFGVTMQEKGVSQLVSVDLKKAEQLVA
ncbi:MAG: chromosome segregation protein SMC [Paracoccaceae bacterium]|nr:chromosome segregation protein SMC [Paracoccaceae bacterium]